MTRALRWLPVVVIPLLFLAALWAITHEFRQHHPREIADAIAQIPRVQLWAAAALTVASYALLTLYDWCGLSYAGRRLPYPRVALASFTAYVFSYNVGISRQRMQVTQPCSNGADRVEPGSPKHEATQLIAWCAI